MKASELRIGNYYNQFGNIHQVNHVIIKDLTKAPDGQLWCKPIQLTEEWLLRMGFKFKSGWDDFNYYTMDGVELYVTLQGFEYDDQIIKTVHRLQNLFFALREKELEIKSGI